MMAEFVPSHYQIAVYTEVHTGKRNIVVKAKAGSGKTRTVVWVTEDLKGRRVIVCAYNNHIAVDMEKKLTDAGTGFHAKTMHSIGNAVIQEQMGKMLPMEQGKKKVRKIVDKWLDKLNIQDDIYQEVQKGFSDLMRLVRVTLTDPEDPAALLALCAHHGIEPMRIVLEHIPELISESNRLVAREHMIDFDDMIYLPWKEKLVLPKFDWVLGDEVQDWSRAQRHIALEMRDPNGGRVLAVGDPCQPAGTLVSVVRKEGNRWHKVDIEQIPIEQLSVGDKVVSYTPKDTTFVQKGRTVLGITARPYNGLLIEACMEDGHRSSYTPNHHCYASFEPLRHKFAVYLMRKDEQYRIGKARMSYDHSGGVTASGPVARARAEHVDAMWLLSVYDTDREATVMEGAIAGRFGIPELIFQDINDDRDGQALIDRAWNFIGNNMDRGAVCLSFFGRDERYPIYDSKINAKYLSFKRPMVVHASNLMDGILMLPYEGHAHSSKSEWMPISLSRHAYRGMVYSLDVDVDHLYVADGVLTRNCQAIYGFAGAEAEGFDDLVKELDAVVLPLSICYRCDHAVLEEARKIVPDIEDRPNCPPGKVTYIKENDLDKHVRSGDFVLCRMTAPLVTEAINLIRRKIPAKVKGRDIGKDLVKTLNTVADRAKGEFRYEDLEDLLIEWEDAQRRSLIKHGADESQLTSLSDKVECLIVCINNFPNATSIDELGREIDRLFEDEGSYVWLSTVHRAKGLENPRIFILSPKKLPLMWPKQLPWQRQQEWNLAYVAATRAQEELIIVGDSWLVGPLKAEIAAEIAQDAAEFLDLSKIDPNRMTTEQVVAAMEEIAGVIEAYPAPAMKGPIPDNGSDMALTAKYLPDAFERAAAKAEANGHNKPIVKIEAQKFVDTTTGEVLEPVVENTPQNALQDARRETGTNTAPPPVETHHDSAGYGSVDAASERAQIGADARARVEGRAPVVIGASGGSPFAGLHLKEGVSDEAMVISSEAAPTTTAADWDALIGYLVARLGADRMSAMNLALTFEEATAPDVAKPFIKALKKASPQPKTMARKPGH